MLLVLLLLLVVVVVVMWDVVEEASCGADRRMKGRIAGVFGKVARHHVVWAVL